MAVTLYYGILMLGRGASDPGEIILVVLAMLFGGATVGQAFQQIDYFNFAISAASELFPVIDRVSGSEISRFVRPPSSYFRKYACLKVFYS